MKTGHTEASGYGLVGTAKQGDRRVLVVMNGLPTMASRGTEGEKLLNWAFHQFAEKTVAKKDAPVAEAPVWLGQKRTVALVPAADATILMPVTAGSTVDAKVVYSSPVKAPVKAGQQLADLVISQPEMADRHIPLVAATDVAPAGFLGRVKTAVAVLWRDFGGAAATE